MNTKHFLAAGLLALLLAFCPSRAVAYLSLVTANADASTKQFADFAPQAQASEHASNTAVARGNDGAEAGGNSYGSLASGTLSVAGHACSAVPLEIGGYFSGDRGGGSIVTDGYFTVTSLTLSLGTPVTINFNVQMSASTQAFGSSADFPFSQGATSGVNGDFGLVNDNVYLSGSKTISENLQGSTHSTDGLADGTRVTIPFLSTIGAVVEVRAHLLADCSDAARNGETSDAEAQAALVWGWDATGDVQLTSRDGYVAPPSSNVNDGYLNSVLPSRIFTPEPSSLALLLMGLPMALLRRHRRKTD